jgi:hypothetical protein
MSLLTKRYADKISNVLSCYDRIIIQGTLPGLCYAKGMTNYLNFKHDRIFDYPRWAEPLREQIRENAERLAIQNGIQIQFLRSHQIRKGEIVEKILKQRGDKPGLVHILPAMESCQTYKPWHDKQSGKTYLKPDQGKCLHYYFYFIDEELGLCYLRVPTWCPLRPQFYFNGHNWLAMQLKKKGVSFTLCDNAFTEIANWEKAQKLADKFDPASLH